MVAERFPATISPSVIPVVFGLAVAVMIYALGHISGAHFNPAVTLAFAVGRHFPLKQIPFYWLAQFTGALAASGLLALLLPPGSTYGATFPSVRPPQALAWEAVLTFFLMFVIMAVATDTRAEGTMAGVAIGGTVMLAAFVGGPGDRRFHESRSVPWPRPFCRAGWVKCGIFILGPVLGAVFAALLYNYLRLSKGK